MENNKENFQQCFALAQKFRRLRNGSSVPLDEMIEWLAESLMEKCRYMDAARDVAAMMLDGETFIPVRATVVRYLNENNYVVDDPKPSAA